MSASHFAWLAAASRDWLGGGTHLAAEIMAPGAAWEVTFDDGVVVRSLDAWGGELGRRGVTRLWLVPGGDWLWDGDGHGWQVRWERGEPRVARLSEFVVADPPTLPSVPDATVRLRSALTDIRGFAAAHAPRWTDTFDRGLAALDADDPPAGFPEVAMKADACRLLSAVRSAWVFGGMGSWNDEWAGPREAYDAVTAEFAAAGRDAVAAAVNAD